MSNKPAAASEDQPPPVDGQVARCEKAMDCSRGTERDAQSETHYQWPPPRDPKLNYKDKSRNPVHSVITALPILMLVSGLFIYYKGESQENQGAPIGAQSITLDGTYTGMSATSDRNYLWLEQGDKRRGLRITQEQADVLDSLQRGTSLSVRAAPHVQNSRTYWVWYVAQSGTVLVDDSETLMDAE